MSFKGWQKVQINTPNGTVDGIAPVIISASKADLPTFIPPLDHAYCVSESSYVCLN